MGTSTALDAARSHDELAFHESRGGPGSRSESLHSYCAQAQIAPAPSPTAPRTSIFTDEEVQPCLRRLICTENPGAAELDGRLGRLLLRPTRHLKYDNLRGSRHDLPTVCARDDGHGASTNAVYYVFTKHLRDSGAPGEALKRKLKKDISFALRRGTIAQVTTALDAAQRAAEGQRPQSSPLTRWVWHGKKPVRSPSTALCC
jgi:hypothetical protein